MAFNGKYVTMEFILGKVYRDNGYDLELLYSDAIEWTAEAIDLIGAPLQYEEKVTNGQEQMPNPIEIQGYRGNLPCDFHLGIQARDYEHNYPMRYNTDSFALSYLDPNSATNQEIRSSITYGLKNGFIFTSFETGYVELAYWAYPVDENGMPKIPDNPKVIEAVSAYIRMKIDFKLWRSGRLNGQIYVNSQQEWAWYVGAAATSMKMPTIDQMESIKNQWLRLIPSINEHMYSFKFLGDAEERKLGSDYNNAIY